MITSRLKGLAALVGIVALIAGVPAGLVVAGGSPVGTGAPSLDDIAAALTRPDDGSLLLVVLAVAGWVAWLVFTAMLLLEVGARLRGVRAPRLPALAVPQKAAAGLVGAAALLFVAASPTMSSAAMATSADDHASTTSATTSTSVASTATAGDTQQVEQQDDERDATDQGAESQTSSSTSGAPGTAAAASTSRAAATVEYTTRAGDSLWAVAERLLGDGARWQEIADLNYGTVQPDGQALDRSHWVGVGWTLQVPTPEQTATGSGAGGQVSVEPGDTLSQIALEELGDGTRYPELYDASTDTVQPGGAQLQDPDHIEPGWTISMPTGAGSETGPAPGQDDPAGSRDGARGGADRGADQGADRGAGGGSGAEGDRSQSSGDQREGRDGGQRADQRGQDAAAGGGGQADDQDGRDAGDAEQAPATGDGLRASSSVEVDDDFAAAEALPVRTMAGVGSLLAVGVIGLIAVRRGAQRRKRMPGQAVPMPEGEAAEVEQELRATGDLMSVETVDLALRTLAARCAQAGEALPVVRAGRLTASQFDLYLAEPARLPSPWESTTDPSVWVLPADAEGLLSEEEAVDVASPYPSLVTVGHDLEDGHVLLDLEQLGALGVTGDPEQTRQVLAAVAVELATSRWADDLQVTVVGAYPQLEDSLATGRVRYLPVVGRLIEDLTARAERDREALAVTGAGDLRRARTSGAAPGAWTPEIVLLAGETTTAQRDQLKTLVEGMPRVAIAAVTGGDQIGDWAVRLTGAQTAVLDPLGLELRPQLLDDHTYAQLLSVLAVAEEDQVDAQDRADQAGVEGTGVAGQTAGWAAEPEPTLEDLPEPRAAASSVHDDVTPAAGEGDPGQGEAAVEVAAAAESEDGSAGEVDDGSSDTLEAAGGEVDDVVDDGAAVPTTDTAPPGEAAPAAPVVVVEPTATGAGEPAAASIPAAAAVAPVGLDELEVGDRTMVDDEDLADGPAADEAGLGVDEGPRGGEVRVLPKRGPAIRLLGSVELVGADGPVEPSKVARLTELATFLALHPGADHVAIDAAHWPGKPVSNNTRNTAMSQLRRWLGKTSDGEDFLPRFEAAVGYRLRDEVITDWHQWRDLVPGEACDAPTDALEAALGLVDGLPISGVRARRYAWAESLRQEMITAIVDAAYVLARRRLLAGRWVESETAALAGLMVEPGVEGLWRARLLALHGRGNVQQLDKAVADLLELAEEWGGELEETTETLLEQLANNDVPPRRQLADAL